MTMTMHPVNTPINPRGLIARYCKLFRLADTAGGGPRAPHPGDIAYWVTCLGAACLLLLAST